ncbi:hypothetical protein SCB73_15850 [Flavobacterium sp. KACC 22761]|nr:hypothetical protein [Flavobacterium sp. KACC 22761]WPO77743.1 hypothetical protein SCB73_15850 [Flavobacterium sp. KACC 22761]
MLLEISTKTCLRFIANHFSDFNESAVSPRKAGMISIEFKGEKLVANPESFNFLNKN